MAWREVVGDDRIARIQRELGKTLADKQSDESEIQDDYVRRAIQAANPSQLKIYMKPINHNTCLVVAGLLTDWSRAFVAWHMKTIETVARIYGQAYELDHLPEILSKLIGDEW